MTDTFAALLRRYRRDAGLSQEALAEGAGLSKDAVSALERGTRRAPYRDTVELLARALRLDDAGRRELEEAAARGRARRLQSGSTEAPPSNLPQMGTTLVGRDDTVAAVLERLEEHPIVAIVGPGGIGKTRVALDVGERFVRVHRTGAWFCDLAAVTHGASIAGKMASAAGIIALGSGDAIGEITTALRSREGLFILDNCEHVIDEAAKAAASIAARCAGLKVLATSRERLALRGENVYRLGALESDAARELFRMRASSAGFSVTRADNDAIDEICGEVDNIPLAIELAAARAPLLGLSDLRARLKGQLAMLSGGDRDAAPRQRTMHATIAWSFDLLDETERALFRRLGIFAAGWGLDALESVAVAPPVEHINLVPAYTSLVGKSLVIADLDVEPVRYRLLEPVRAFAMEQLRAAGEVETGLERHARWISEFAATFAQSEAEHYSPEAIGAALSELDNARAALEWSLKPLGDVVVGAQIVGGMRTCWLTTGLASECRRWCELILAKLDVEAHPVVASQVFRALVSSLTGHRREQMEAVMRAIPVHERAGDWSGLVSTMSLLVILQVEAGRLDEAQEIFGRIDRIRRERDLRPNADWITVLMHRAYLERLRNRFDESGSILDAAITLARTLHRPFQEMWALLLAGEMAFACGDREKAIAIATDALAKSRTHRHVVIEIFARSNLAGYYIAGGDVEAACMQARAAISRGDRVEPHVLESAILHLATAAVVSGGSKDAARLKGYCDARYAGRQMVKDPSEVSSYAVLTAGLEAKLSADEIAELEREGALLDDGKAAQIAIALSPSSPPPQLGRTVGR